MTCGGEIAAAAPLDIEGQCEIRNAVAGDEAQG
jgi:hypothetical protein